MTFAEIGIKEKYVKAIEEIGFKHPMPVQEQVIPHLFKKQIPDIIALAQTGTGKTAAFGLPLIQNIDTSVRHTQFLILCPTRELCLQISDDLVSFAKYDTDVKIAAVFGGASIDRQIKLIKKGVHIISATPGRLLDLINRKAVDLSGIKIVVLDEADEMLNMGFREDLIAILKATPKEKNTLLFSATMPDSVRKMADKFLKNAVEITVGEKNTGADTVNHISYIVHARDRYNALKRIIDFNPRILGIIFCRTRRETQQVADHLIRDGYNADALHGDLSQPQRDKVMQKFRSLKINLLVATDVAARGIDVDNLTHIINYNLPDDLDVYTHRSGRTGRAGRAGTSIVIANMKEKQKLAIIERKIKKSFENLPVPHGSEICEKQLFQLIDNLERTEVDNDKIEPFMPVIMNKLAWIDREELIKKMVSIEFKRFLDCYKESSDLNVKENRKGERQRKTTRESRVPDDFTRFFINTGKIDGLNPITLIGLINEFTGENNIRIGQIDIMKNFSFFEAESEKSSVILNALNGKDFNNQQIVIEIANPKRELRDTVPEGKKKKKSKQKSSSKKQRSAFRGKKK